MKFIPVKHRRITRSRLILGTLVAVAIGMALISSVEGSALDWRSLGGNLSTELIGAVITYLIIESIVKAQADNTELKDNLIRRIENPDVGLTYDAVQTLRSKGWLQDGSLYGWFFKGAHLCDMDLRDANFNGVGFYRSNLQGAKISDEQLASMNDLRRTIMPDGTPYDGRYCLPGDIHWALTHYGLDVNTATPAQMAAYYEVSIEQYMEGQKWAQENLPRFHNDIHHYLKQMTF